MEKNKLLVASHDFMTKSDVKECLTLLKPPAKAGLIYNITYVMMLKPK